jgi:hypothetical protein
LTQAEQLTPTCFDPYTQIGGDGLGDGIIRCGWPGTLVALALLLLPDRLGHVCCTWHTRTAAVHGMLIILVSTNLHCPSARSPGITVTLVVPPHHIAACGNNALALPCTTQVRASTTQLRSSTAQSPMPQYTCLYYFSALQHIAQWSSNMLGAAPQPSQGSCIPQALQSPHSRLQKLQHPGHQ